MITSTSRWRLWLAGLAVAFAAADTYVVVLALPDMMISTGLTVDSLQKATPIISGFLLGYIAILPIIGRISDLHGRLPVLIGSLWLFALGSLITALSTELTTLVIGRFLQGIGAGGLVPATLALVADTYPPRRRAIPLGIISGVQEFGSVLGPLLGAIVLALASWQYIFWLNFAFALGLSWLLGRTKPVTEKSKTDWWGWCLAALSLLLLVLCLAKPAILTTDVTWGLAYLPLIGELTLSSPIVLAGIFVLGLFGIHCWRTNSPIRLAQLVMAFRETDPLGSILLVIALGGVILTFATSDPTLQLISPNSLWYLTVSGLAFGCLMFHLRRHDSGLIPRGSFSSSTAKLGLLLSFLIGFSLIAALLDIPVFARLTVYPDSQLGAALVLVRFLFALAVGAFLGGWLCRRSPEKWITCLGLILSAFGFFLMANWSSTSLTNWISTIPLLLTGLGFGLVLAPINNLVLAHTSSKVHGLSAAMVVVARMMGMLIGISVLTAFGLRKFHQASQTMDPLTAALTQSQTIFFGAGICAVVAAILSLLLTSAHDRDTVQ